MIFFNDKYKKICATCKMLNDPKLKDEECPIKKRIQDIIEKAKEKDDKNFEPEIAKIAYSERCEKYEPFFFKPFNCKEILFEEFQYNVLMDKIDKVVKVCRPDDEERLTLLAHPIGFLPIGADADFVDDETVNIVHNFALGFYVPALHRVLFDREVVWVPYKEGTPPMITEEEFKEYKIYENEIINHYYPNLYENEEIEVKGVIS